jgi:hypothetical protein
LRTRLCVCRDCTLYWRVCGVCAASLGEECHPQHPEPAGETGLQFR